MEFPQYWKYVSDERPNPRGGDPLRAGCWGWSNDSEQLALAHAQQRLQTTFDKLARGETPTSRYPYADRPLREQVVDTISNSGGNVLGLVTRNSYGALVLNSANTMFVDVDLPEKEDEPEGFSFFGALFQKKSDSKRESDPETNALNDLKRWVDMNSGWAVRVYRTRAGLRYLMTHAPIDPQSSTSERVLDALGSDPLYTRLCRTQKCYRARLTPKPWRIDHSNPPHRFPFQNAAAQDNFNTWLEDYNRKCREFATCRFITSIGNDSIHDQAAPVIKLHDHNCKVESSLPLA